MSSRSLLSCWRRRVQELQGGDPQRIGPYRLVGRLGAGGMGMVFAARSAGGQSR